MADFPAEPSPSSSRTSKARHALLKQLRERYGEVLADHQRLLREACEGARLGVDGQQHGRDLVASRPTRSKVVRTIEIGGTPHSVAVGEGAVWVTVG